MKSNIAFKGCDVVKAQRKGGVKKILATFSYDVMLFYWVEKPSIAMANALGQSIGMGYVRDGEVSTKDEVIASKYELEVATVRVKAEVALTALRDP